MKISNSFPLLSPHERERRNTKIDETGEEEEEEEELLSNKRKKEKPLPRSPRLIQFSFPSFRAHTRIGSGC